MNLKEQDRKMTIKDILLLLSGLTPIAIMLLYVFFSGLHDEKVMREYGADTECVMISYAKGSLGRGPTEGYHNRCAYSVNDSIYYCYVFTSVKPLPVGMRLKVRYLMHKDGRITIDFPDEYKEVYKEYGFNDYH